jgi:hypothetical protein
MKEPLLGKKDFFSISKEALCSMFTLSNLNSKDSLNIYNDLGGITTIVGKLESSLEVNL